MNEVNLMNEYRHSVDAKNRLFIPAKHRELLGHEFVVSRSVRGHCLKVYPLEEWNRFTGLFSALSGAQAEKVNRFIYRYTISGEPDAQGRIILNDGLIEHAQIQKDVVIIGCGRYAEIWAKEQYELEVIDNEQENQDEVASILDEAGI